MADKLLQQFDEAIALIDKQTKQLEKRLDDLNKKILKNPVTIDNGIINIDLNADLISKEIYEDIMKAKKEAERLMKRNGFGSTGINKHFSYAGSKNFTETQIANVFNNELNHTVSDESYDSDDLISVIDGINYAFDAWDVDKFKEKSKNFEAAIDGLNGLTLDKFKELLSKGQLDSDIIEDIVEFSNKLKEESPEIYKLTMQFWQELRKQFSGEISLSDLFSFDFSSLDTEFRGDFANAVRQIGSYLNAELGSSKNSTIYNKTSLFADLIETNGSLGASSKELEEVKKKNQELQEELQSLYDKIDTISKEKKVFNVDELVIELDQIIEKINYITTTLTESTAQSKTDISSEIEILKELVNYLTTVQETIAKALSPIDSVGSLESRIKAVTDTLEKEYELNLKTDKALEAVNSLMKKVETEPIQFKIDADFLESQLADAISSGKIKLNISSIQGTSDDNDRQEVLSALNTILEVDRLVKNDTYNKGRYDNKNNNALRYLELAFKHSKDPAKVFESIDIDRITSALKKLQFLDDDGNFHYKTPTSGSVNGGGIIGDKYTIMTRGTTTYKGNPVETFAEALNLKEAINKVKSFGGDIGDTLLVSLQNALRSNNIYYDVMETVSGSGTKNSDFTDFSSIESILKYFKTVQFLNMSGVGFETVGDNVLYDKDLKKFSPIDLNLINNSGRLYPSEVDSVLSAAKSLTRDFHNNGSDALLVDEAYKLYKNAGLDEKWKKEYQVQELEQGGAGYRTSEIISNIDRVIASISDLNINLDNIKNEVLALQSSVNNYSDKLKASLTLDDSELQSIQIKVHPNVDNFLTELNEKLSTEKLEITVSPDVVDSVDSNNKDHLVDIDDKNKEDLLKDYFKKSGQRVLSQTGLKSDGYYSYKVKTNEYQTQDITAMWDDDINDWVIEEGQLKTNFKQLENAIINLDNKAAAAADDLEAKAATLGSNFDKSAGEANIQYIKDQAARLYDVLLKAYSNDDNYEYLVNAFNTERADNENRLATISQNKLNIRTAKEQNTADAKAIADAKAKQKAIDSTNRNLQAQLNLLDDIQAKYDKSINNGAKNAVTDQADLTSLNQDRSDLISYIKSFMNTEISSQDMTDILEMVADFKRDVKIKQDSNNVTKKELGGAELDTRVSQLKTNYESLIQKANEYHNINYLIIEDLEQQYAILSKDNVTAKEYYNANSLYSKSKIKITANNNNQKQVQNSYKQQISLLDKIFNINKQIAALDPFGAQNNPNNQTDRELHNLKLKRRELQQEIDQLIQIRNLNNQIEQSEENRVGAYKNNQDAMLKNYTEDMRYGDYGKALLQLVGRNSVNDGAFLNLDKEYKSITSKIDKNAIGDFSSIQKYIDSYITKTKQQIGALGNSKTVSEYGKQEITYLLNNALQQEFSRINLSNISFKDLNNKIRDAINNSVGNFINTTYNSDRFKAADQTSVSGINQKMTKFLAENSMSSDDKTILNNLISATSKGASLDQSQLKDIVTEFNRIQASSENANNSVSAFFKSASKYTADYARQFMQQYLSLYDFIRYFREAVSAVEELDTALTELKVVSNASSSQLKNVSSSAYNIAQELGSSTTEIVESITDWRRLGESIEDATTLAEQSSILSTGGFMEVDTATEALTSSMQAFGYSAENASDMVDQFIYLGNNYAITSEDLATSLENASAAMVAAGNSFEQTEALEIAGNTIMQDANSVANALKTVSMRLRGTTASALEDAGEDTEGLIEDASKLYKTVKELTTTASNPDGVSIINEATGAYKSTYEILLEISKVYNQLSDAQQASLLETIAGKTRGSAVAAILQSGDILESAYTDAMENATGAGDDALEASMDSIEKKVAQFTNSLKNLANDSLDSSLLKSIVDFGTKIINIIDKVSNSPLGSVGLIGAIIGGTAGLTGKSAANLKNGKEWLAKIDKGFHGDSQAGTQGSVSEGLSAITSPVTGIFSNIGDYLTDSVYSGNGWTFGEKEYQDIQNYNNSLTTLRGNLESQTITQEEYDHQLNTLRNSLDDSTASVRNYASQLRTGEANINDLTQTTRLAQFAQAGFNAALNVGISLLISAAVTAISKLITAEQDFADATQAAGEEMKTLTDSFDDYESQVESLRETLDDTTSSFEDQVSARESLYNIQEQLIETYGSEAEGIDLITTSADEAAQALDTLYQKQLEKEIRDYNEENDGVFSSIARGGKTASEAAEDKIDNNKTVLYDALATGLSDDDKSYISTFIHDTYGDIVSIREGGLSFNGSAYENLEALEGIYSAISSTLDTSDKGVSDFLDNIQTGISKVEDIIDSYGDVVDTQTLLDIYNDEDAKSYYDQLATYYNQYKEAVTEGDTETSDSRKEQFLSLFDTMSKDGNIDESIVSYIERLYPTLQAEISQWEFKVAITADTNGIYTQIKDFLTDEAVFGGMDVDQIETAGKTGTSSEQNAYQYLLEQASAFGFSTVKEMLEYLNTIGVVTVHTSEDTQAISNIDNTLNNQGKEFTDDTYSSTSDWYDSKDSEYQAVVQTEEYSAALEELTSKSDKAAVSQKDLEKAYKKAYAALHEGDEKSFSSLMDGAQQTIDKFSTLTDVYEDVSDGDDFDWSSILNNDDFDEQFSKFTDTYEDFIQTITENPTDIKKCQDAFDNLATDWFYSSGMLSNLTEENKKAWVTMAKQSGIANAQTLATNYLAAASEYAATAQEHLGEEVNGVTITTTDLTEATESEIAALMNEGTMSESTSKYLLSYYIEKLKAAGLTIDTSGDVANLSALMTALGLSTKSLTAYYVAKSQASKYAQDAASFEAAAAKETDPEKKKNILAKADKYNGLAASSSAEAASELSKTQTQITSVKMDNKNKVEVTTPTGSGSNSSGSDKNGSGSDSSSSDDAETIDWIEVKLNRLSDTIDKLDQRASRTWSGWTSRTKVLKKEISSLNDEIKTLKKASTYYKKYATDVKSRLTDAGLKTSKGNVSKAKHINKLIQKGKINISDYSGKWADYIQNVQDYWEKGLDADSSLLDAQDTQMEKRLEKIDNIQTRYENLNDIWDARADYLESSAKDSVEDSGHTMTNKQLDSYYTKLNQYNKKKIATSQNEYDAIKKQYDYLINKGLIAKNSEEAKSLEKTLLELQTDIQDIENAIAENTIALNEAKWDNVKNGVDYLNDQIEHNNFIIDLMGYQDTEENHLDTYGNINDYGQAVQAIHLSNIEGYTQSLSYLSNAIDDIKSKLADDPTNTTYISNLEEMTSQYEEQIKAIYEERDAIIDLIQNAYDAQLSYMQELIDAYEEMLDSQKSLYDYQKNIKEKTDTVATYEKQLAAIEGDNSEEAKSRRQQIQNSLKDAQEDLEETEYEQFISDQKDMLQTLYDDTTDYFDVQIADVDARIEDTTKVVEEASDTINKTLTDAIGDHNLETDTITTLFGETDSVFYKRIDQILSTYSNASADGTDNSADDSADDGSNNGGGNANNSDNDGGAYSYLSSTASKVETAHTAYDADKNPTTRNNYDQARLEYAKEFINAYAKTTTIKRSELPYINGIIYDYTNGKILSKKKMEALFNVLKQKSSSTWDGNTGGGNLATLLEAVNFPGFARGGVISDDAVNLSDLGLRASNGDTKLVMAQSGERILTPAQNEAYEQLGQALLGVDTSTLTDAINFTSKLPEISSTSAGNTITSNVETMTLSFPNVTNYEEFISKMKNDSSMEKWLQAVTLGQAMGQNSLTKRRY